MKKPEDIAAGSVMGSIFAMMVVVAVLENGGGFVEALIALGGVQWFISIVACAIRLADTKGLELKKASRWMYVAIFLGWAMVPIQILWHGGHFLRQLYRDGEVEELLPKFVVRKATELPPFSNDVSGRLSHPGDSSGKSE